MARSRAASFGIHFLIAGVYLGWPLQSAERSPDLSDLAPRRTIEARLPGLPFGDCPLVPGTVGLRAECARPDAAESTRLARAGWVLRGRESAGPRSSSRPKILSSLLTASSAEDFAICFGQLERRAGEAGLQGLRASAEAATDLAAAYLLRAEVLGDANDFLSAAEAAQAALDLEPDFPPALFNLALAYERLLLRRAAVKTWSRLLRAETDDGWTGEAEAHLAKLQEEMAAEEAVGAPPRDVQAEREAVPRELLSRWARDPAAAEPGGELERQLAGAARRSQAAGDPFIAAVLAALPTLDRRAPAAYLLLEERQEALEREDARACAPGLHQLEKELGGNTSPLRLLALHLKATCAYRDSDLEAAERAALAWQQAAIAAGFRAAAGRATWFRGTIASARGRFSAAQSLYREALLSFESCGEIRNVAVIHMLLANAKARSGDPAGAWRLVHSALRRVIGRGTARDASLAMHEAALQLGLSGRSALGLLYGEEMLPADLAAGEIAGRCDARWLRCWLLHKSGRRTEAARELEKLRAEIAGAEDARQRGRFERLMLAAESELYLDQDPRRSAAAAAAALESFESLSFDPSALDLHLHLGRALARLDDTAGALAALDRGLRYFAAQARENPEIPVKVRLFDRASKMLEEKMQLELRQGNRQAAFDTLEAGRAHLLLDEMAAEPAGLAAIQQALGERDLLVEYLFLGERALAFRVGRESFELVELAGDRNRLRNSIDSWWLAGGAEEKRIAEQLHQLLLRPLAVPPQARLLISFPDELAALPWAALRNQATSRRAIEENQLLTVPSASAMLAIERRGRSFPSFAGPALLAAGDPAFDPTAAPGLARTLPGARDEARAAAAAFADDPLLLEREAASGSAFIAAMARRPLVLYAGHALADIDEPLATRLFFAPDAVFPTGELKAGDFYRRQLPAGALVVLSGCETGGGYGSKVEGRLDLAHPFLASGAGQVILTRRAVLDRAAQKFLYLFFDRLRATGNPWESFREAQLAAIENDDENRHQSLPTWAIYQLVGGRWQ